MDPDHATCSSGLNTVNMQNEDWHKLSFRYLHRSWITEPQNEYPNQTPKNPSLRGVSVVAYVEFHLQLVRKFCTHIYLLSSPIISNPSFTLVHFDSIHLRPTPSDSRQAWVLRKWLRHMSLSTRSQDGRRSRSRMTMGHRVIRMHLVTSQMLKSSIRRWSGGKFRQFHLKKDSH